MNPPGLRIGVSGGSSCSSEVGALAYDVGLELARRGCVLLCGGGGGVMERAAAGARQGGGQTVGVLPGGSAGVSPPNESIEIPLFTGMGQARNVVLVLSSQAVIAIDGGWGTLSEIALAVKQRIPVVLLESWASLHAAVANEPLVEIADTAEDAVTRAIAAAGGIQQ